jgi:hypothetical protein
MKTNIRRLIAAVIIAGSLMTLSCGKSKESKEAADPAAHQADSVLSASIAAAPFKIMLEEAGFSIVAIDDFPTVITRRTGQAVVYRFASHNRSGGILYFKNKDHRSFPTWHWYFDDGAPSGIQALELNEDGLWDIQITMSDGEKREYLHDEDFTLTAEVRSDWIALNAVASSTSEPDHPIWQCLDGQRNTAWRSSLQSSGGVFLEVWAPFGIRQGILTVQTSDEGRPRECELLADGKPVKQFTLENRAGEQRVQLGKTFSKAVKVRFVVHSSYAENGMVAIAEFKLE